MTQTYDTTISLHSLPRTRNVYGRVVRHDSRSRNFAAPSNRPTASPHPLVSVRHHVNIPILDQGNVGSCTANATAACIAADQWWGTTSSLGINEDWATDFYSAEETLDGDGPYPPNDNGSSGLTAARLLKQRGIVDGYTHAFSLDAALAALSRQPVIIGVSWYSHMEIPDRDGRLSLSGRVVGGHEVCLDEIDADNERVWLRNSWGPDWGVEGRAYLTFADLGTLLADHGDCTVFNLPAPAPVSMPPTDVPGSDANRADAVLATSASAWLSKRHTGANARFARDLQTWLDSRP